ncbi:hypothetical protein GJ744_006329 [Endocarpon pusillum]|uniref:Uncharacterized protein n=1 Tax=Endocarpon pusillum TaxID=364733 RepID=A0A8H7AJY7_9EURO|nr:hypothetical protein GJ744_006329 [Endocarpon pusillum]
MVGLVEETLEFQDVENPIAHRKFKPDSSVKKKKGCGFVQDRKKFHELVTEVTDVDRCATRDTQCIHQIK